MDMQLELEAMLGDSVRMMLERQDCAQRLCKGQPAANLWDAVTELGLVAAEMPESVGGLGLPASNLLRTFEQIGYNLGTSYLVEFTVIGGWLLTATGAPASDELAPAIAKGSARIALAAAEHGDDSNLDFTAARARKTDAGWTLDGHKTVVIGGDRATHLLVTAWLTENNNGIEKDSAAKSAHSELGLFLVDCTDAVGSQSYQLYDGSGAADFCIAQLHLDEDRLVARGDSARALVELALDRGRAALCQEASGLVDAVCTITLDYVKTRRQFGQAIGHFQTMQHRLADMAMDVELTRTAAALATEAVAGDLDASTRMKEVSIAKHAMATSARRVGQSAIQAHGGIALTREYIIGHYFKRLTMIERYLGSPTYHLQRYMDLANSAAGDPLGGIQSFPPAIPSHPFASID